MVLHGSMIRGSSLRTEWATMRVWANNKYSYHCISRGLSASRDQLSWLNHHGTAMLNHHGSARLNHHGSARLNHHGTARLNHHGTARLNHHGTARLNHHGN